MLVKFFVQAVLLLKITSIRKVRIGQSFFILHKYIEV